MCNDSSILVRARETLPQSARYRCEVFITGLGWAFFVSLNRDERGKRGRTNGKAGRCSPSDELGVRRTTRLDLKTMVQLALCNYMVHKHGFNQLWIKNIREKECYVVADVYMELGSQWFHLY